MNARSAAPTATGQPRPTPLHPYPQPQPTEKQEDEKAYPPELGTDAIAILEGRTFMLSNSLGDVPPGSIGGLLHNDTRFVSGWELTLAGQPLSLLKSAVVDYYSASFFLTNPDFRAAGLRANSVAVRRLRFVGNGIVEQIVALNSSSERVSLPRREIFEQLLDSAAERRHVNANKPDAAAGRPGGDQVGRGLPGRLGRAPCEWSRRKRALEDL
jgi:N-terminal domain of (some) glycogen debranching enzymes